MTEIHTCPADGCDYSGTRNSVAAHYSGTTAKPDHEGGYERAKTRMGATDTEPSQDTESKPQPESKPESAQSDAQPTETDTGGSDPSQDMPAAETGTETTEDTGDDVVCPDDGGELVDFTDLTTGKYHKVQGEQVFVAGDYVCVECGSWWMEE